MSLLNQIIGAVAAEEAVSKLDPEAGFLKKSLSALAGFEGEKMVEEKLQDHETETTPINPAS